MPLKNAARLRSPRLAALLLVVAITALAAPRVHAAWEVTDQDTHTKLDDVKSRLDDVKSYLGANTGAGSINSNINNLNQRLNIGGNPPLPSNWPGNRVADPTEQPWSQDVGNTSQCSAYALNQQALCQELIKTRNAYYKFMNTMYDTSKERNLVLTALVNQRKGLDSTDYGKLEDNTNRITALYTQIALDRQQMESLQHGYRARIDYLNQQLTQKSADAANGRASTDNIFASAMASVAAGVVLQATLNGLAKTRSAPGRKTLLIDQ